ncbi:hypothetical protein TraAM80_06377 [Trypanosoma rangeli]|uniref:Uncharacterized protein n=1 Tax=Trypanosoma rangeli TaxID=5698 RepID=A0A3R7N941_TRYRA|nr:uncharacterized protein TraAM80_06377 [Trypanosoma rangeli]RNF02481.1 hypothetical protein TraAM80_06377 [Trypanosoma rangeli]|eukprot:RNF02481.1 hypothetical protein TraAM80_06377 [Trypanosoma rangeli]
MGDGERTLHEGLQELHARKLHGGVLWLLARRASPTPQPEQKLLKAATTVACTASTCVMLKSAGGNVVGDEDGEDRVSSVLQTGCASGTPRQGSIFLPFLVCSFLRDGSASTLRAL